MSAWAERYGLWQRWHAYVLARKGVEGEEGLRAAIRRDLEVASVVAKTLFDGLTSRDVVCELFDDQVALRDDVLAVVDEDAVNHLGFQIHEPLDLWLEGLPRWAPQFECEIVGVKRFTASETFRASVGSFVEMAQVWLRRDGVVVELELFDIHRPNPPVDPLEDAAPMRQGQRLRASESPRALRSILAADDIWHYGVRITDEAAVEHLHQRFASLVDRDHRFPVRAQRTVANPWHGSVQTKLTNLDCDTEIEFLTYRVDWAGRR